MPALRVVMLAASAMVAALAQGQPKIQAQSAPPPTPARQDQTQNRAQPVKFTTLPGFTIERVVPESNADSYIVLTFDSLGRPFVSKEQDHPRVLLDKDRDGIFESEKIFTDEVRNCQGLWFDGRTLYGVCAPGDELPPDRDRPDSDEQRESGLYRMEDTDGDDEADTFEQINAFESEIGEHGPHAIRRGPDGRATLMIGNNSFVPDDMVDPKSPLLDPISPWDAYKESQFLPAFPDGRGFGNSNKEGVHGSLVRLDLTAKRYTLVFGGLRNAYDIAFNLDGEAFTFDSDMEWDINLPWYRDVRTVHGIPGGNYGYRNGSGKLPPYYLDSLPPVRDLGRGSPVGVEFYQHNVYPKEFHDAYVEADWSRGRLLWTPLTRDGATYRARDDRAELVHGEPLNITDIEVGPDGLLYFSTGGRGTAGGMYRLRYDAGGSAPGQPSGVLAIVRQPQPLSSWGWAALEKAKASMGAAWGSELEKLARDQRAQGEDRAQAIYLLQRHGPQPSGELLETLISDKDARVRAALVYVAGLQTTDEAKAAAATALKDTDPFVQRRAAEALVRQGLSPDAPSVAPVADIYNALSSPDRFARYAARLALMRTPRAEWEDRVLQEVNPVPASEGLVALVETAGSETDLIPVLQKELSLLRADDLSVDDKLRLLRAFQLTAIAAKSVPPELRQQAHTALVGQFPNADERLNRELALTLGWAGQPEAIDEILTAMSAAKNEEALQIHYVYALRAIKSGWTKAQKAALTEWFARASQWRGGASFGGSINLLFNESLEFFDDSERQLAYEKVPVFAPLTASELAKLEADRSRSGRRRRATNPATARAQGVERLTREEIYEYQLFVPLRTPPDAANGRTIYDEQCAACHRFGGVGTEVGPDLTTINGRFQKKDILEAIIWPSRTISDQYQSTMVETSEGQVLSGLIAKEDAQGLHVRTAEVPDRPVLIPTDQIKKRSDATVSMMPEGLVDDFDQQEIADLIAFLQGQPPE